MTPPIRVKLKRALVFIMVKDAKSSDAQPADAPEDGRNDAQRDNQ